MKLVIIIAVALLLLGGGGAGAYFYFKHPAEAATGAAGEVAKVEKDKKKDDKDAKPSSFVKLDPLVLPVVGNDGVTEVVSLVVAIEAPDDAAKAKVTYLAPKLRDVFIQDMYGVLTKDVVMKDGIIQVTLLKDRLRKLSVKVLGQDSVNDVLIQTVQQRAM